MKKYILIAAAGEGIRFKNNIPKQFVTMNGKPLLFHTINAFLKADEAFHYVLVLSENMIDFWKELCKQYRFKLKHQIVLGGKTRQLSVMAGLKFVPNDSVVAIHDGVRPLISKRLITEGFMLAEKTGSAIPVSSVTESLLEITKTGSRYVDREKYRLVQTPQFFHSDKIKDAYNKSGKNTFTDDASAFQNAGYKLSLFEGDSENIKITRQSDLILAETMLK